MSQAFRIVCLSLFVIAYMGALAGCGTVPVVANPNSFEVRGTTQPLRVPQTITLTNGYSSETKMPIGSQGGITFEGDMRQLTDVAIEMMSRHLGKNGVKVGSGGKTITLRMRDVRIDFVNIPFAPRHNTTLALEAQLGDGTVATIPATNGSPGGANRSVDGAILFAITALLNDSRFVGYVNR